jgi:hypothetical protein
MHKTGKIILLGLVVAVMAGVTLLAVNRNRVAADYKNIAYMINGQSITLRDGVSEIEAAPGSEAKIVTQYFGNIGKGDLNGDGIADLAFLLTQTAGGSGTFYYVVGAMQNAQGGYAGTDGVFLGDRIAPQTTEILEGKVIVNYADRAPGEPFTTPPSVGKSIWLKLDPAAMQFGEVIQDFEGESAHRLSEAEARAIAERSCIKGGEALAAGTHNRATQTWWFDANVNAEKPGCTPACVVSEVSKTAEINWRCTGLACTEEAKICPDRSAVGRTGPNCEFAKCPTTYPPPVTLCTKDSDCPSSQYVCQEIQGMGTACPSTDPSCVPTHTIIQGECKLKEGNRCSADADCAAGNLCHKNICVSPIGKQCGGPNDMSCPADFECVQGCGPPVAQQDDPPPPYFCELKGYERPCPICLAKNTFIDTPRGAMPVQDIQKGTLVWTLTASGMRVPEVVVETGMTPVSRAHKIIELVLDDGRMLSVSPGHPTIDSRTAGSLSAGDSYDGARVVSTHRVLYDDEATYDILPSGETGFYFANGILFGSTLFVPATSALDAS